MINFLIEKIMNKINGSVEFDYGTYTIKCLDTMFDEPTLPVTSINNKIKITLPNPLVNLIVSNMDDKNIPHPSLTLDDCNGNQWHIQKAASRIKLVEGDNYSSTISVNIINVKRHYTKEKIGEFI